MRPIETRYGGVLFRSRLEARWAVFFTRLGLEWEHESQGYRDGFEVGPAGKRVLYLPDFHLPALGLYLEVKPAMPNHVDPEGVKRWQHFAGVVATEWEKGRTAMLVGQIPNPDTADCLGPPRAQEWYEQKIVTLADWQVAWCACPSGRHFDMHFQARGARVLCGCPRVQDDRQYFTGDHPDILNAYGAARSARFEHGDVPAGAR
jgi:hypothetical protein